MGLEKETAEINLDSLELKEVTPVRLAREIINISDEGKKHVLLRIGYYSPETFFAGGGPGAFTKVAIKDEGYKVKTEEDREKGEVVYTLESQ